MPTTILLNNSMELQQDLSEISLSPDNIIKTGDFRKEYAKVIAAAPYSDKERAEAIAGASDNEPIFEIKNMHAEDLPKRKDLIQMSADISVDLTTADYQIIDLANKYTGLIAGTINRINAVKERILRNEERLEDINFITSAYKGLNDTVPITAELCTGSFMEQNGVFSAFCPYGETEIKEPIQIISVEGNGYVGNNHVLSSGDEYLVDTENRGKLENLSDNSPLTVFEYSRICSKDTTLYKESINDNEESSISSGYDINNDDKDVTCTITLKSASGKGLNMIRLDTPNNKIKIVDVQVSKDNIVYRSVLKSEIDFRTDMYHSAGYIAGGNIISFPTAIYVKLVVTSDYSDPYERLGYDVVDLSGNSPRTVIRRLNNAIRKVVQIAGINAFFCEYSEGVMLTTDIAPAGGCKTVAVFANEYIPFGMDETTPIKYELHINGKKYDVTPINSDRPGTKIISCTESKFENANVEFIDEKIETVQLRVKMDSDHDVSPFVGNLKLCVG